MKHVSTYTDIVKRLNKNLHGDDEAFYTLPASQELAAQYLLLYELSLPFGLDLTNQLNFDKSSSRMRVSFAAMGTQEFIDIQARAKQWLQANAPEFVQEGSSMSLMFTHIGIRVMMGSIKGALIALVLISIILVISLKSLRIGLISIVPNILPGMVGFGVWYLLRGEVGMSTSMVLGITMGIVVDDTVHFLSKYIRARRDRGLSVEDGVRYAFSTVGVALWVTTIVLVGGFLILGTSDLANNGDMGLLVAIVISIALIFDFILLPPLLMLLDRGDWVEEKNTLGRAA
ncbi:MAG: MMPL family transporter [Gammaproteobacteria bacterium]|nr:MMPL family transporter [Gammaproteobacteria bacterium]